MKNKKKYPRFKFISRDFRFYSISDFDNDFNRVENPLPYNNLPDGEYQIRGNKKEHSKYYWVKNNKWFLTEDKTKDNGHYMCESTTYILFPSLPEQKYQKLQDVYDCLSPVWKRYVYGYFFWKELREMSRKNHYRIEKYKK